MYDEGEIAMSMRRYKWQYAALILALAWIITGIWGLVTAGKLREANLAITCYEEELTTLSKQLQKKKPATSIAVPKLSDTNKPIGRSRAISSPTDEGTRFHLPSVSAPRTTKLPAFSSFGVVKKPTSVLSNKAIWIKVGKETLAECHKGETVRAGLLRIALKYCALEEIEPRFTFTELFKYLAQEALAECRKGDVRKAYDIRDAIYVYCIPLDKIDSSLTKEELAGYVTMTDNLRRSRDEKWEETSPPSDPDEKKNEAMSSDLEEDESSCPPSKKNEAEAEYKYYDHSMPFWDPPNSEEEFPLFEPFFRAPM